MRVRFRKFHFCAAPSDVFVPSLHTLWGIKFIHRNCNAHFWRLILTWRIYKEICPCQIIQIPSSTLAVFTSLPDKLRWPVPSIWPLLNHLHHFLPSNNLIMLSSDASIIRCWISMGEVLPVINSPKTLPLHINSAHEGHLTLVFSRKLLLSQVPPCTESKMFV